MNSNQSKVSYWKIFRVVFVFFSLYLLGDVLYRWDSVSYYASFTEFFPSVTLLMSLWSAIAIFVAILIWLPVRTSEWLILRFGLKVRIHHVFMFMQLLVLLGITAWIVKLLIVFHSTTVQEKLVVFLSITFASAILTWVFRNNSKQWMDIIQDRITVLVWLVSVMLIFSVIYTTFHILSGNLIKGDEVLTHDRPEASSSDKHRPNIILITFDALTARNMSVYGYHKQTTPFIAEWAKDATLFTNLESASNVTWSATASLTTGKRVWTHRLFNMDASKVDKNNTENVALELKRNGYYNMAFVVNDYASVERLGISESFDIAPHSSELARTTKLFGWDIGSIKNAIYRLVGKDFIMHDWIVKSDFALGRFMRFFLLMATKETSQTEVPPEIAFEKFLSAVDSSHSEPFFAWIHLYPPHHPYLPPDAFMGMFDQSTEFRTFESQDDLRSILGPYKYLNKRYPERIQPKVDIISARYDEFIRYCDSAFKDFINRLSERNLLDNTVIIFSADHGESFEHGYYQHGGIPLFEQVTHIPLIIKKPGQNTGMVINDVVRQIDIPVTILDIAKITVPFWMEGRSLEPLMRSEKLPGVQAFSMNFSQNRGRGHKITKGSIAVREGDYKLIYFLDKDDYQLYDLRKDPGEVENIADKNSEIAGRLLSVIKDTLEIANKEVSRNNGTNHDYHYNFSNEE